MSEKPCIICVAITGSLPKKSDNPAVPITIDEQIESAHEAFEAGATIVHAHVRNDEGGPTSDPGRFAHRRVKSMRGAFKTPTLRDVALTAPYMRNGIYDTLTEVVEHYNRGGDVKENLDINMSPLGLTADEVADVVAFMESLTGAPRVVSVPVLPR